IELEARSIFFTGGEGNDQYEVADLRHPYETIPTHFTGLAIKIFQGTKNRYPCIELKCSPAKIIQGHNVFGSTSIELGANEMIMALYNHYPDFFDMLDIAETTLDLIDVTYSARVANELQAKQVIQQLKNVSHGQMRTAVDQKHETTCYFNKGSRHVDRKVYLKGFEFAHQLKTLREKQQKGDTSKNRVIDVMSDPKLINYARHLVRFEATAHRRYLDDIGIPKKLFEAIRYQKQYEQTGACLIADIWKKAFTPLMTALEGQTMNIFNDDEIHTKLKAIYFSTTPKGNTTYSKADRIFRFYRSLVSDGYSSVYQSFTSRQTFSRHLNDLMAVGFSKAQLQNLQGNGNDNVIPLLQVIQIDFSQQRPSDYVEPEAGHLCHLYDFTPDQTAKIHPRPRLIA
ncbi:phage/plasmid replication protein, II/X family, partial [Vibrio hibernica]|uniref:phage/plasmid replication protein, II/X family n=1 Tax=Vibrio hibernica TaxID=2587465 RepID=UPI0039B0B2A0